MCSVIEIKNANEYYIRYHGPESMQQQQQQQQQQKNVDGTSVDVVAKTDLKFSEADSSGGDSHTTTTTTGTHGFVEGDTTSSETGCQCYKHSYFYFALILAVYSFRADFSRIFVLR